MQKDLQPKIGSCTYTCASCGSTYEIQSTKPGTLSVDVCSSCHPFYVGSATNTSLRGRAEKLSDKFNAGKTYKAASKTETKKTDKKSKQSVKRGLESL